MKCYVFLTPIPFQWMFLQMNPEWKGDLTALDSACFEFYSNITQGRFDAAHITSVLVILFTLSFMYS